MTSLLILKMTEISGRRKWGVEEAGITEGRSGKDGLEEGWSRASSPLHPLESTEWGVTDHESQSPSQRRGKGLLETPGFTWKRRQWDPLFPCHSLGGALTKELLRCKELGFNYVSSGWATNSWDVNVVSGDFPREWGLNGLKLRCSGLYILLASSCYLCSGQIGVQILRWLPRRGEKQEGGAGPFWKRESGSGGVVQSIFSAHPVHWPLQGQPGGMTILQWLHQ